MLFGELLDDRQISDIWEYALWDILTVPIEEVWSWVRGNVHIALCGFEHERDSSPWRFFQNCTRRHLNLACGHTYSLDVLMNIIQEAIARVCETKIETIRNICGNPSDQHNSSASADQSWRHLYWDSRRSENRKMVASARFDQSIQVLGWSEIIHSTLCAFEEVVFVKNFWDRLVTRPSA